MSEPVLELRSISKNFGSNQALRDVDLVVPHGSLIVLLGPAGAGKTTTLRIIAGLEAPSSGEVFIERMDFTKHQPNQRDIAMIFDNLALYPNKSGYENIASPLRISRTPKDEINRRVMEMAELMKISHILERTPATFSGGERQRVALGRAMIREPRFYLLDEPLSSLDFMLRIDLRTELKRLQQESGRTFLFATPDYTEALALADTVCVLIEGQVRQIAKAQELYDEPIDRDVARFVGNPPINIVPARLTRDNGTANLAIGSMNLVLPAEMEHGLPSSVSDVEIGVRPEHVRMVGADSAESHLTGTVNDLEPLGMHTTVGVNLGGVNLFFTVPGVQEFSDGDSVEMHLDMESILFFDPATGRRLS
ncbi:MAG: ABC transporter ATP-binding protein [Rhodospirillales bacterium]|jgi:multiple sugar transport system ATP-binding protein|nr:ABC transporter ATP-binding protein [Rhodospirillales bacterium]MDP6591163.1 ABC transporter ATP-binding protein [Alphaproteobacteria bacterium]